MKNPSDLVIVGIDCPVDTWPELADPDRDHTPSKGLIESVRTFGVQAAVSVVKRGKHFYVKDGRRRTLAARAAQLPEIPVSVDPDPGESAPLQVLAANSYRQDDPIWIKAKHAERLRAAGFNPDRICAALEENGKPISKMTLTNYRRLLNCIPEVLDKIKRGELPFVAGYEIGAKPAAEQGKALAAYIDSGEGEDEGAEEGEPRTRGGGGGGGKKSRAMPKSRIQEFYAYLEPGEEDEPDHDCDLACALLAVVLGLDPDGSGLRPYKSVAKLYKKALG